MNIEKTLEAITVAIEALDKAEKQFYAYFEHHKAKSSYDKAETNYQYSLMCSRAKERLIMGPLE